MTDVTFHIGERVASRYRILSQLGAGGSGVVFDAHDEFTSQRVALKLPLVRERVPTAVRARLLREAEVAARVRHENAAHVLRLGEDEGVPYLVMERLLGRNLRSLLRGAPFPWRRVVAIGSQVAAALAAAHDRGVVHADVKPENIFLARERGRVLLIDFGLAQLAGAEGQLGEGEGGALVPGTPLYMSPEQACGRPLGSETDVYSLGCVLYELTTGVAPFDGTPAELMKKHVHDPPPSMEHLADLACPSSAAELLQRMVSKSPSARPSAVAVREVLTGSAEDL